ncbi:abortive infection system antitoxin AbiGi family protein [Parapedobacter deserti]|uniref:Abortive infection system antitoxin AbiGi family protein n=1 Tax=Parapedobacter deserti TaxID=1912957 RepID=A0ABV7JUS4_9SPHI
MAISTTSVIHYTKEFSILKKILKEGGFKYKYCVEKVNTRGKKNYRFAIAMVSFCDIPLSEYKKHFYKKTKKNTLGYYGDYGIGLNYKWVSSQGLNPVIYIESNSVLSTSVRHSAERLLSNLSDDIINDENLYPFYTKNFKGLLERDNIKVDGYRFYDEREWRFVPTAKLLNNKPNILDAATYENNKDYFNEAIERQRLQFSVEDISYIIIKEEAELEELSKHLEETYPKKDFLRLMPKIITSKQIIDDF